MVHEGEVGETGPRLSSCNWSPDDALRWETSSSIGPWLGAFLWISQPSTCAEEALRLGEGQKEGEDASWSPSWLRDACPHQDKIWRWLARDNLENCPYISNLSCPYWGQLTLSSLCVPHIFFFSHILCSFHTHFVSNKCFCLFHNLGLFAEFFLQRKHKQRSFFQLLTTGIKGIKVELNLIWSIRNDFS